MRTKQEFVNEVFATFGAEHGINADTVLAEFKPAVEAAFELEGQVSSEDLDCIVMGNDDGEVDEKYLVTYPQLMKIAEEVAS